MQLEATVIAVGIFVSGIAVRWWFDALTGDQVIGLAIGSALFLVLALTMTEVVARIMRNHRPPPPIDNPPPPPG